MRIFSDDTITHDAASATSGCPQCRANTALTLISRPDFNAIKTCKPATIGLSFLCLKCLSPVMIRFTIKHIAENEIGLGEVLSEENKSDGSINLNYLPPAVKKAYVDALGCYQHDLLQPFALMCRQTIKAIIKDLGDNGKMRVFNQIEELRHMLNIDPCIFDSINNTLFDNKQSLHSNAAIGKTEATVLHAAMKDLLYQIYVRKARLQRAFSMRQFFAKQSVTPADAKIAPIRKPA